MIAEKKIGHTALDKKTTRQILLDLSRVRFDTELSKIYEDVTKNMISMIKDEKLSDVYHFCFIPSDGQLLKGFKAVKNTKNVNVLIMPGSQALANGLLNFLLSDSETGN